MSESKSVSVFTIAGGILLAAAVLAGVWFVLGATTTVTAEGKQRVLDACMAHRLAGKEHLKRLYVSEEVYRAEKNTYGTLKEIDAPKPHDDVPFQFDTVESGATWFTILAVGTGPMRGEQWTINDKNRFESGGVDVCARDAK